MSFLSNLPSPQNNISPTYKLLVDELFVKLDAVNKESLGTFRTVLDKKFDIIEQFVTIFKTHIGNDIVPSSKLIFPEKAGRLYYIRDVTLARLIVKMYLIPKDSEDYNVLYFWKANFHGAKRFQVDQNNLRDLPLRASRIIVNRRALTSSFHYKEYTVDEINVTLDNLATAKKSAEQIELLKPVLDTLSVPEVRWLLHTLLKKSILTRFEWTFFKCWHPDAPALFKICNSLEQTLHYLVDPEIRMDPKQLHIQPTLRFRPQLSLKLLKNYDKLIKDLAFKLPMDQKLTEMYDQQNLLGKFFMEEKMDGDRMVLHKSGKFFKFFLRRLKDYTFLYGENYQFGSLTKHLEGAFHPKVDTIVLDGEMVAWDFERQVILPFGTLKSSAIQELVRQYTTIDQYEQQSAYPFFLIFDVLHINGINMTNHPLFFRKKLLHDLINPIPHRLEILPYTVGQTPDDIRLAIKKIIGSRSEGVMVKHPQSIYQVDHRSPHWIKIKPEYLEKFGENVDVVVIGKVPAIKNSYMCGLKDEETGVYLSFCTVANGFTVDEFDRIDRLTSTKWRNVSTHPHPPNIRFGTRKPKFWIDPEDSIVLEIKARSIDNTVGLEKTYATGTTLHNLYCRAIREDKTASECVSYQEYLILKERYHTRTSADQIRNKKRRVMDSFELKPKKKIKVELSLFEKFNFIILSDKVDQNGRISKDDIISLVTKYGGKTILSPDQQTLIITERNVPSCTIYTSRGMDLIRPNWIFECINRNAIVPLEPLFVFSSPNLNLMKFLRTDHFGDSLIIHSKVNEINSLLFIRMTSELYLFYQEETLLEVTPVRYLFRKVRFYIIGENLELANKISRFGGEVINDIVEIPSYVIVSDLQRREAALSELDVIMKKIEDSVTFDDNDVPSKIPSVVEQKFLGACIERNVLLDGDDFKYI